MDSSIIPCTLGVLDQSKAHLHARFAPAALHSWDFIVHWYLVQSFRVQEPNHQESIWAEQLIPWHANYAHGERCWGKEKSLEFPLAASHVALSSLRG